METTPETSAPAPNTMPAGGCAQLSADAHAWLETAPQGEAKTLVIELLSQIERPPVASVSQPDWLKEARRLLQPKAFTNHSQVKKLLRQAVAAYDALVAASQPPAPTTPGGAAPLSAKRLIELQALRDDVRSKLAATYTGKEGYLTDYMRLPCLLDEGDELQRALLGETARADAAERRAGELAGQQQEKLCELLGEFYAGNDHYPYDNSDSIQAYNEKVGRNQERGRMRAWVLLRAGELGIKPEALRERLVANLNLPAGPAPVVADTPAADLTLEELYSGPPVRAGKTNLPSPGNPHHNPHVAAASSERLEGGRDRG